MNAADVLGMFDAPQTFILTLCWCFCTFPLPVYKAALLSSFKPCTWCHLPEGMVGFVSLGVSQAGCLSKRSAVAQAGVVDSCVTLGFKRS